MRLGSIYPRPNGKDETIVSSKPRLGARRQMLTLGFQPPGPRLLLLNGHGEKNKQGSPNRIVRATLSGEASGRVLCATFETIFKSVLI